MGNRLLKENIRMSPEIDALSWFEEVFFYRLIVTVDDYGIYNADPVILTHLLFPRKENISRRTVEECLKHLEELRLIERYSVPGKGVFLRLKTWEKHQRLRSTKRKFPFPEEGSSLPDPDGYSAEDHSAEPLSTEQPEEEAPPAAEDPAPVITLPLNDGSEYGVTQREAEEYAALYPSVDILQELRGMRGWCLNNAKRRKTRNGIRRFMNSWLSRVQDRGGSACRSPGPAQAPENPFGRSAPNPYRIMLEKGEVI